MNKKTDLLIVDNIIAAQTPKVEKPFKDILNLFDLIIEIGFHRGGFSLWLYKNKNLNTTLVCYDITKSHLQVKNSNIDFRIKDCYNESTILEIKKMINNYGKTLLLCDGGKKEYEFKTYAPLLKKGDVIMMHDYSHTSEDFKKITTNLSWYSGAESHYECAKCVKDIQPFMYDNFKDVLWGSFIKV